MVKTEEERKCIVCGETLPKEELLRFTLTPDCMLVPDFKKKLPGRGIWVKNSKTALEKALAKNLFSKVCHRNVKIDAELLKMVENLLRKKGLEAVSLARKAGVLVTGFDKVSEALRKNKVAFLLEAKDAGADGHEKIMALAGNLEVFRSYSIEELDTALDKVNTVHAAFIKSKMAQTVYNEFKKFENFLNS